MADVKRQGLSFVQYEADGVIKDFPITFPYISKDYIQVMKGDLMVPTSEYTFSTDSMIEFKPEFIPEDLVIVTIRRNTKGDEKLVDFTDGGIITEELLDLEFDQVLDLVQEAKDVANSSVFIDINTMTGDAAFARLINLGDAQDPQDAMNKRTTEAMFNIYAATFDQQLIEIQQIEDNVENIQSDVNDIKIDYDIKYNEIQDIALQMDDEVIAAATSAGEAEDAKDAAIIAQGLSEDAADRAELAAGIAEDAKDQVEDLVQTLEPMVSEFPELQQTVEDLEISVGAHTSSSENVHGIGAGNAVVGTNTVQEVSNKRLMLSSVEQPSRLDVKQDTYNNLVTYATSASDGQLVYAYDIDKYYGIANGLLVDLGGTGGGLDTFYIQDMESFSNVSVFSTGNNALFMGGGTLQGTLSLEESAPISGTKSLKYVQASGSVNDYFASPVIDIDIKQKNNTSGMTFYFEYDGNDNDGRFVVYDVTNSVELASEVNFVKVANSATRYSLSFYVPESCNQISWGYKVLVENTGKALIVDDVEMTMNPFMYKDISNNTDLEPMGLTAADFQGFGTVTNINMNCARDGEFLVINGNFTSGTTQAVTATLNIKYRGVLLKAKTPSDANYSFINMLMTNHTTGVSGYSLLARNGETSIKFGVSSESSTGLTPALGNLVIASNTIGSINVRIPIQGWTATTENVLTPSDTFSTDTAPLTWAAPAQYTLNTLANAPIGTYITMQYAANSNTRTQCATRPTQTDASMNQNGMQIFTRAYNAASTAASPAAFAVQIGKGMKGTSLGLYKSLGKSVSGIYEWLTNAADTETGLTQYTYDATSGILSVDAGYNMRGVTTVHQFLFSDNTLSTNGFLTINAGRTLPLLAVPMSTRYIVKTYSSGTDWWEVYNDGWVRQGGNLNTGTGGDVIVSYLISMKNSFYKAVASMISTGSGTAITFSQINIRSYNATSITLTRTSEIGKTWEVEGFGASSAVRALGATPNY